MMLGVTDDWQAVVRAELLRHDDTVRDMARKAGVSYPTLARFLRGEGVHATVFMLLARYAGFALEKRQ